MNLIEEIENYKPHLVKILDEAYQLYMPQVRPEILQLADFVENELAFTPKSQPFNVVEIGTKFGGTFYIWNLINNQPNGLNISIDMEAGIHGGVTKEEMDKRDLWFYERFDNCRFIRGNSHDEFILQQLKNALGDQKIDFLFIDGDHTYEGVKKDFEMYSPFLKKGSLVGFHDIIISDHHHERDVWVGEFWEDLTKSKIIHFDQSVQCTIDGERYKIFEFIGSPEQNWAGIGVLLKLS